MNYFDGLKLQAAEFLWNLPRSRDSDSAWRDARQKLLVDGCCAIDGFLDTAKANYLAEEAQRTYSSHEEYVSRESSGTDERIYGAERVCGAFTLAQEMPPIDVIARAFYWPATVRWFQMLGRITYSERNLGSGSGWHRDSPFSHQFKAILYLTDVGPDNGPFEYIEGSHLKRCVRAASEFLEVPGGHYRYSDEQVERLEQAGVVARRTAVTGKKGTLLLADSRGLHRGRPLNAGRRLAVTRYYFPRQVPEAFTSVYPLTRRRSH